MVCVAHNNHSDGMISPKHHEEVSKNASSLYYCEGPLEHPLIDTKAAVAHFCYDGSDQLPEKLLKNNP